MGIFSNGEKITIYNIITTWNAYLISFFDDNINMPLFLYLCLKLYTYKNF